MRRPRCFSCFWRRKKGRATTCFGVNSYFEAGTCEWEIGDSHRTPQFDNSGPPARATTEIRGCPRSPPRSPLRPRPPGPAAQARAESA